MAPITPYYAVYFNNQFHSYVQACSYTSCCETFYRVYGSYPSRVVPLTWSRKDFWRHMIDILPNPKYNKILQVKHLTTM